MQICRANCSLSDKTVLLAALRRLPGKAHFRRQRNSPTALNALEPICMSSERLVCRAVAFPSSLATMRPICLTRLSALAASASSRLGSVSGSRRVISTDCCRCYLCYPATQRQQTNTALDRVRERDALKVADAACSRACLFSPGERASGGHCGAAATCAPGGNGACSRHRCGRIAKRRDGRARCGKARCANNNNPSKPLLITQCEQSNLATIPANRLGNSEFLLS